MGGGCKMNTGFPDAKSCALLNPTVSWLKETFARLSCVFLSGRWRKFPQLIIQLNIYFLRKQLVCSVQYWLLTTLLFWVGLMCWQNHTVKGCLYQCFSNHRLLPTVGWELVGRGIIWERSSSIFFSFSGKKPPVEQKKDYIPYIKNKLSFVKLFFSPFYVCVSQWYKMYSILRACSSV